MKTHLRVYGKPQLKDEIRLDMYMTIITKRNKKFAHSCLIEELTKKSMSSEGKFSRLSVLIALPIEKLEAQRRRLKF